MDPDGYLVGWGGDALMNVLWKTHANSKPVRLGGNKWKMEVSWYVPAVQQYPVHFANERFLALFKLLAFGFPPVQHRSRMFVRRSVISHFEIDY